MASAWRNLKNISSRLLFTIIFRTEMLKFHPYSILTGETMVRFVIYCVLSLFQHIKFDENYILIELSPSLFKVVWFFKIHSYGMLNILIEKEMSKDYLVSSINQACLKIVWRDLGWSKWLWHKMKSIGKQINQSSSHIGIWPTLF